MIYFRNHFHHIICVGDFVFAQSLLKTKNKLALGLFKFSGTHLKIIHSFISTLNLDRKNAHIVAKFNVN